MPLLLQTSAPRFLRSRNRRSLRLRITSAQCRATRLTMEVAFPTRLKVEMSSYNASWSSHLVIRQVAIIGQRCINHKISSIRTVTLRALLLAKVSEASLRQLASLARRRICTMDLVGSWPTRSRSVVLISLMFRIPGTVVVIYHPTTRTIQFIMEPPT